MSSIIRIHFHRLQTFISFPVKLMFPVPYSNWATPAVSIAGWSILVLMFLLLATACLFPILLFVFFKHELFSFPDDTLSRLLKIHKSLINYGILHYDVLPISLFNFQWKNWHISTTKITDKRLHNKNCYNILRCVPGRFYNKFNGLGTTAYSLKTLNWMMNWGKMSHNITLTRSGFWNYTLLSPSLSSSGLDLVEYHALRVEQKKGLSADHLPENK